MGSVVCRFLDFCKKHLNTTERVRGTYPLSRFGPHVSRRIARVFSRHAVQSQTSAWILYNGHFWRVKTQKCSSVLVIMTAYVAYYFVSTDRQGATRVGLDTRCQTVKNQISAHQLITECAEVESGGRPAKRRQSLAALDEWRAARHIVSDRARRRPGLRSAPLAGGNGTRAASESKSSTGR